ncbi:helix-turn-helix transcriptional regulator [Lentisalinibacter orientalis]|uniref:helix-turn-helix transcriptional regulator n=1 Tax=Lentisalinibacter orientalis TaxID=2992241 RepID=UPI00386E5F88
MEDDEIAVILAAIAHSDRPPLSQSEITLLERFRTHLIQAIEVYRTFQRGLMESVVARRMLDALTQPVLLIDDTQYVHHANTAALDLIGAGRVAAESNGTFNFRRARDSGRLSAALRQLGLTGDLPHEQRSGRVAFRVSDRLGEDSHLVVAIAVRPDESMAVFGKTPRVILLFHPLEGRKVIDPLIVSHAFSLTPAEAQVAAAIAAGASLSELAEARGVSLETVRSQLRGVFAKVGVSRQSDLARVLSALPQENLDFSQTLIIR